MPDHATRDQLAYLDGLYAAVENGGAGFVVRAVGPGFCERQLEVVVLGVAPPVGRQRKPQVRWRWADEDEERTCSVGTFRRFTWSARTDA